MVSCAVLLAMGPNKGLGSRIQDLDLSGDSECSFENPALQPNTPYPDTARMGTISV